ESSQGWPAIDIAATGMTYTTFAGRVKTVVNDSWGGGFGTYVTIEADCDGKRFEALWSHMALDSIDPAIKVGAEVGVHQLIGEVDDTGESEGNHVHYAFNGLEMKEPYIPQNPKSDNCTSKETCDVEW
ncbi:MAG TPA: M23 family metallopeptidase, partial [Patescibacteria group bacterium]|nr:M23 family metallopeptidase [Patescibacteria group bacterium]